MLKVLHVFFLLIIMVMILSVGTQALAQPAEIVPIAFKHDKVDVEYPQFTGLANDKAQEIINAKIKDAVNTFLAEQGAEKYLVNGKVIYQIRNLKENLISLTMKFYWFTGGAHGLTHMRGMTFDTASGHEYSFKEIHSFSEKDKIVINEEIARQITQRRIPVLGRFEGVKENPDYYLGEDGCPVIFFQLYELAPYAWGFVEFPLN